MLAREGAVFLAFLTMDFLVHLLSVIMLNYMHDHCCCNAVMSVCAYVYIVPPAEIPLQSMVAIYSGRLRASVLDFENPDLFRVGYFQLFVIILNHLNKLVDLFSYFTVRLVLPEQKIGNKDDT